MIMEFAYFFAGCAFTMLMFAMATWTINIVDTIWGHRQHRKIEDQKIQAEFPNAVGNRELGFKG